MKGRWRKVLLIITVVSTFIITGCTTGKGFEIEAKEFTEEQNEVLVLTGSRAAKYELKNYPNDKNYELRIVYEVYNKKEKVKEEIITATLGEPTEEKIEDDTLLISIQDKKIRILKGGASSYMDIDEDIHKLSNGYFAGATKIAMNDEIYLFQANSTGRFIPLDKLGVISKEELSKTLEANDTNIFIKLVYEEIKK